MLAKDYILNNKAYMYKTSINSTNRQLQKQPKIQKINQTSQKQFKLKKSAGFLKKDTLPSFLNF